MSAQSRSDLAVAIAAGAVFALGLGVRQAQPLFIGPINSATGIGYAAISLAFAIGQLMWGVAQPVAGAIGPALLISSAARWIPEAKRNFVNGIVNAGGSFGQFTVIPLAQLFIGLAGWQPAMVILGVMGLAAIPILVWITQGHAEHAATVAKYLAERGVAAVGADNWGVEVIPFEKDAGVFEVHQILLPMNGIYILENMNTEEMVKDKAWEFLFTLGPSRVTGAVQAIINPIAIK